VWKKIGGEVRDIKKKTDILSRHRKKILTLDTSPIPWKNVNA